MRNNLRGVIYTNLRFTRDQKIETAAGSLLSISNFPETNAVIYEIEELMEDFGDGPGVLVSHGISSYI